MTPRTRLVVLAVAVMAAVPGLVAVDGMVLNGAPPSSTVVVGVLDQPGALVATPAGSQPVLAAIRGLPLFTTVLAVASISTRGRQLPSMTGFPLRLVDAGDTWRALLLGAPPILL